MAYCPNVGGIVFGPSLMNTCHVDNEKMVTVTHTGARLIHKDIYPKYLVDKRNIVIVG